MLPSSPRNNCIMFWFYDLWRDRQARQESLITLGHLVHYIVCIVSWITIVLAYLCFPWTVHRVSFCLFFFYIYYCWRYIYTSICRQTVRWYALLKSIFVSFWLPGCCEEWEGGPVNQVNHTSWVAVVTPTDRPKTVRNRYLIELFCGVVCVVTLPFWHFCWCRGFCHRTESDLLLFVFTCYSLVGAP